MTMRILGRFAVSGPGISESPVDSENKVEQICERWLCFVFDVKRDKEGSNETVGRDN